MPIEQVAMSFMAVLMLLAALMGSTLMAGPVDTDRSVEQRRSVNRPMTNEAVTLKCTIDRVDVKARELTVIHEEVSKTFKMAANVRVTKDQQPAKLSELARGDYATLTLTSGSSAVITRIEVVSSQ